MNNRRRLVVALGTGVFATPLRSFAQPKGKVRRIGFLGVQTAAGYAQQLEAFRGGLKDCGYVEGNNLNIEYRWAEGDIERLPQLAAELLHEKVEILVTHGLQDARAAQRATATVPIVLASVGSDLVALGLVKSLARPGGNITGSLSLSGSLSAKQLELVKDALPTARKVAFVFTPAAGTGEGEKRMQAAAKTLKLDLQFVEVTGANEFEAAIAAMTERSVDAIIIQTTPLFAADEGRIATHAARRRIPALGNPRFAERGGLMGYGTTTLTWRRTAYFVDRILKGAKPADLPIEQPTNIELVINLKTARALGIRIPETVMVRADRVIH